MSECRYHKWRFSACLLCFIVLVAVPQIAAGQAQPGTTPSDQTISDGVQDEFLFDPAVPTTIEVTTKGGVVKLSGLVGNLLAKERAERLAGMVRGVRAVVNNIVVRSGKARPIDDLKADVKAALARDPATDSYEIQTIVDEKGSVRLRGKVDSWAEKDLAEKVVQGVRGVTDIENDLVLDIKSDRPDSEIKADIIGRLRWDALVDHEMIDVGVRDGKVRLAGTVGSWSERAWAHHDAWVAGVTAVDLSGLKIEDWARDPNLRKTKNVIKSDRAIEEGLRAALRYDPRVKSFQLDTAVLDGVATLRGTVDNLAAKRAAERDAYNTVGVKGVVNRIRVVPGSTDTDLEIAKRIRSALVLDPHIERYEFTVRVVNGVAKLYGLVDLYFDKARAEDVASRVAGVVDVDNFVEVRYTRRPLIGNPYTGDRPPEAYGWYDYQPYRTLRSDASIKKHIEANLTLSPHVNLPDVKVKVDEGRAILTGTVDSAVEYQLATQTAYKGGAAWVDNRLKIEPGM